MKYPLTQLVKAYYDALQSVGLPVYDGFAPNDAPQEYIVIGDRVVTNIPQDSNQFTECLVTFDVNTKTKSYGFKGNSSKVDAVLAIVNNDNVLSGMSNFTMDNQVVEDIQPLNELAASENHYRTIIRVRAYITEK